MTLTAIIIAAIAIFLYFRRGKVFVAEPVNHNGRCHWCNEEVLFGRVFKKCPNCGDLHMFHRKHGVGFGGTTEHLSRLQPRCGGKYVGHPSSHTISLKNPGSCALCHLAKPFWSMWYCSRNVVQLNNERIRRNLEQMATSMDVMYFDGHPVRITKGSDQIQ